MSKLLFRPVSLFLSLAIIMIQVLVLPPSAQASDSHHAPSQLIAPSTEADLWLESTYAMAGSAAGNATVVILVIGLDVLSAYLPATSTGPQDILGTYTPWLSFLLIAPILGTYLALELFYPKHEMIQTEILPPALASLVSTIVHTALMFLAATTLFNQGNFKDTFYLVAPAAFITAILFEGVSTAYFYDKTRRWGLSNDAQGGLKLAYTWQF